jgi:4-amino-4-deoxy-L-arabinose transferase-like glycosyltransferase
VSTSAIDQPPDAPHLEFDGPQDAAPGGERDSSGFSRVRPYLVPTGLALLVGVMALLMFASHRPGHWWGDDWALYVRQSKSLLDGNPGAVTADNHFTVAESLGAPFSPPLYPWGFPLLMAPFIAVVGTDVDRLAIVPVLCACLFACSFFALARRRVGTTVAFVATVAATLTPLLFSWTELIQSEWPFLAVTFAMLVAIDRAVDSRVLTREIAPWWPLVLLGIGAAAAFSVRREGLAMVAAIGGAQLALLTTGAPRFGRLFSDVRLIARLLVPHVSALATVYVLQWTLPSTLVPQYSGTSLANTYRFWQRHVRHIAEVSGLKRPWDDDTIILGSELLGDIAVVGYFVAAVAGILLAITMHRRRDLHLVVYTVAAFAIGGSFRSALSRYLATVGPVLFLLGLVALVALPGPRRTRWGAALATAMAVLIVAGNLANVNVRVDNASLAAARGAIEWGPTHPAATEMFDAVIANSEPDDIVAAPKARAMTLVTDRRAIQVDQWRPLPTEWSPALVVTERSGPIDTQLQSSDDYHEIWSNAQFVIYQPVQVVSDTT